MNSIYITTTFTSNATKRRKTSAIVVCLIIPLYVPNNKNTATLITNEASAVYKYTVPTICIVVNILNTRYTIRDEKTDKNVSIPKTIHLLKYEDSAIFFAKKLIPCIIFPFNYQTFIR